MSVFRNVIAAEAIALTTIPASSTLVPRDSLAAAANAWTRIVAPTPPASAAMGTSDAPSTVPP